MIRRALIVSMLIFRTTIAMCDSRAKQVHRREAREERRSGLDALTEQGHPVSPTRVTCRALGRDPRIRAR